nr:alpha/beta hydrolase [Lachnospiraceae bacterium]
HGGGWVYGDKELYQFYCMSLTQRGFAVVNFSYRLAPDSKFPAQVEDINEVFGWVLKNREEYGFDRKNIFAVGDSAGAHLLGVYANILTNGSYAKRYPFKTPKKLKLRAIALNCGKYDMAWKNDSDPSLKTILKKDLLPGGATKKERELIGVHGHVTEDFPPAVIMTCPGDFLMSQAILMVKALEKNRVPFRYIFYESKEEQLFHVFHVNMRLKAAAAVNDEECEFFRRMMKEDQ